MKGIILAGGSGSRLYPLTNVISKQLLPVYDKPMIYYPLSTLMLFGIRRNLLFRPRGHAEHRKTFRRRFRLGLKLSYKVQEEPKGIAQAFTIGADFIGSDDVCLILGDNIFYMGEQQRLFEREIANNPGGTVFGYHVSDPQRFAWSSLTRISKRYRLRKNPNSRSQTMRWSVFTSTNPMWWKSAEPQAICPRRAGNYRFEPALSGRGALKRAADEARQCLAGRGNAAVAFGSVEFYRHYREAAGFENRLYRGNCLPPRFHFFRRASGADRRAERRRGLQSLS